MIYKKILLQSFFNSNSHGNGHTDHGGARGALPNGRYSDLSEWPRSVSDAGGNTKESTGHRNRGSNTMCCDSDPQPACRLQPCPMVIKKVASAFAEATWYIR